LSIIHSHPTAHELREELWNAITHGAGAIISIGAAAVLITLAALWGNGWQLGSAIVFSIGLIMLYTASTLYHAAKHPTIKSRLKIFDHCAIFILIAASYTPFSLISLREHGGWWLFAAVWSLAIAGLVFKLFFTGRFKLVSTLIYLAMGWLVIFAIKPMIENVSTTVLIWLFAGGAAYTLGTLFYMAKKLKFAHTIWHGFVMAGSGCHYVAIAFLVW
jgi:hemolysin III